MVEENAVLIGKEKINSSKYLVKRSSGKTMHEAKFISNFGGKKCCENCGDFLPEGTPYWKNLCKRCYKRKTFSGNRIKNIFERNDETSFANNSSKFDGVEHFWKKKI